MRIRSVKPEFWTDSTMAALPLEARLLYVGLWNMADDKGALADDPSEVRLTLFPSDDLDVEGMLDLLHAAGRIAYGWTEDDERYLWLPHFLEHQRINHPTRSKYVEDGHVEPPRKAAVIGPVRRALALKYGCEPGEVHEATCFYCGAPGRINWPRNSRGLPSAWIYFTDLEIDHFLPEEANGETSVENLILSCRQCNRSKGWRLDGLEFIEVIRRLGLEYVRASDNERRTRWKEFRETVGGLKESAGLRAPEGDVPESVGGLRESRTGAQPDPGGRDGIDVVQLVVPRPPDLAEDLYALDDPSLAPADGPEVESHWPQRPKMGSEEPKFTQSAGGLREPYVSPLTGKEGKGRERSRDRSLEGSTPPASLRSASPSQASGERRRANPGPAGPDVDGPPPGPPCRQTATPSAAVPAMHPARAATEGSGLTPSASSLGAAPPVQVRPEPEASAAGPESSGLAMAQDSLDELPPPAQFVGEVQPAATLASFGQPRPPGQLVAATAQQLAAERDQATASSESSALAKTPDQTDEPTPARHAAEPNAMPADRVTDARRREPAEHRPEADAGASPPLAAYWERGISSSQRSRCDPGEQVCTAMAESAVRRGCPRPKVTQRWRKAAQLMLDGDERLLPEVLSLIAWTEQDPFWRANVLSVPKLREKYDQLRLQRERQPNVGQVPRVVAEQAAMHDGYQRLIEKYRRQEALSAAL